MSDKLSQIQEELAQAYILCQSELKKLLRYCPVSGSFIRIKKTSNSAKMHQSAGYVISQSGYRIISLNNKKYQAHKLAFLYMDGVYPEKEVDHINHIKDDNSWSNLRLVSHKQNGRNQKLKKSNTSGFNGVTWNKKSGKWRAEIKVNGKSRSLGLYSNKDNAIKARVEANRKYSFHFNHGE